MIRQPDGALRASDRLCPHEQADLAEGRCAGAQLWCPRHAASFDLAGGGHISAGWTSPPLRLYPVRRQGEEVWVELGID